MTIDATQVRSAIKTELFVAPVGTAMPTDVTTALAAAWVNLGHHDADTTPSLNSESEREEIKSALSYYPVRITETGRMLTSKFKMIQRSADTIRLAFGGGDIVESGTPPAETYTYTPPALGVVDERAFVFQITDGLIIDRYRLYRGLPILASEIEFKRGAATAFELEVAHMESASGDVWDLVTNDDAMATA
jgi:hypothetical protein